MSKPIKMIIFWGSAFLFTVGGVFFQPELVKNTVVSLPIVGGLVLWYRWDASQTSMKEGILIFFIWMAIALVIYAIFQYHGLDVFEKKFVIYAIVIGVIYEFTPFVRRVIKKRPKP